MKNSKETKRPPIGGLFLSSVYCLKSSFVRVFMTRALIKPNNSINISHYVTHTYLFVGFYHPKISFSNKVYEKAARVKRRRALTRSTIQTPKVYGCQEAPPRWKVRVKNEAFLRLANTGSIKKIRACNRKLLKKYPYVLFVDLIYINCVINMTVL